MTRWPWRLNELPDGPGGLSVRQPEKLLELSWRVRLYGGSGPIGLPWDAAFDALGQLRLPSVFQGLRVPLALHQTLHTQPQPVHPGAPQEAPFGGWWFPVT